MDQNKIKAGDVVQLKSGGAIMTVEEIEEREEGNPYATCSWFDEKKIHREKIYVIALKPYDNSQNSHSIAFI